MDSSLPLSLNFDSIPLLARVFPSGLHVREPTVPVPLARPLRIISIAASSLTGNFGAAVAEAWAIRIKRRQVIRVFMVDLSIGWLF